MERTSLDDKLLAKGITDIYVCGLAYDVCVGMYHNKRHMISRQALLKR